MRRWRAENAPPAGALGDPQNRETFGDLLYAYGQEALGALLTQARVFADEAWVREQSAANLAILHGVLFDKQVRLLQSFEPPGDESLGDRPGPPNGSGGTPGS